MYIRLTSTRFWLACLPLVLLVPRISRGFTPFVTNNKRFGSNCLGMSTTASSPADYATSEEEEPQKHRQRNGVQDQRTLYDVLGATPNATRTELKRNYVELARQTHPDALIGKQEQLNGHNSNGTTTTRDFHEIASAWRILSDTKMRKRYDRELMAHAFEHQVGKMASQLGTAVAPAAKHVVDKWAMPFMERAATTTMVSFSSAAEDWGDSHDLKSAVEAAIKAGKYANQVMDRMSLLDESDKLRERAMDEIEKAMHLKAKLTVLIDKRLHLALQTPNSALSASEALKILDGLNTIDSLSLVDRARLKHRIVDEIESLEQAETDYFEQYTKTCTAQETMDQLEQDVLEAQEEAKQAMDAQDVARKILEEAQARVIETRNFLYDKSKELSQAKTQHRRSNSEMGRCKASLEKRQEKVRQALQKKAQDKIKKEGVADDLNQEEKEEVESLSDLDELRSKEQKLITATARLEGLADEMMKRAEEMMERAGEMEKKP